MTQKELSSTEHEEVSSVGIKYLMGCLNDRRFHARWQGHTGQQEWSAKLHVAHQLIIWKIYGLSTQYLSCPAATYEHDFRGDGLVPGDCWTTGKSLELGILRHLIRSESWRHT